MATRKLPGLAGLRRFLSIYGDAPLRNAGAIAVFACGIVLLLRLSPLALLPFLVLVWANAGRLALRVHALLKAAPWLLPAVPAAAIVARLAIEPPAASDDLLRHIAVAFWPGGYADMYVHTGLPPHPLYPAFDGLLGWIARRIGPPATMWLAQAAAFAAYSLALIGAGLRVLADEEDRWYWVTAGWLLLCSLLALRISLARPEMFMAAWAIAAVIPRRPSGIAAWVLGGLLLGASYWLAPVYYAAALLLNASLRTRLLVALLLGGAWLVLWWWLTAGELPSSLAWTLQAVRDRIPGISIGENTSIFAMVGAPEFVLLAIGAAWAVLNRSAAPRYLALAGFFMLANQVRYANVIAPMLLLSWFGWIAAGRLRLPAADGPAPGSVLRPLLAAGLLFFALGIPAGVPKLDGLARFALPQGAVVLGGDLVPLYSALFHNPGRIRVSPAFEVGAARPEVQQAILDLPEGRLDCEAVIALGFTHLIERSYRGAPAPCMHIVAVRQGWRLWRLAPP